MVNIKRLDILKYVIYGFLPLMILLFLAGCDRLLEEALTQDVTIEEALYESGTFTAEGEIIPIVNNMQLAKGSFFKTMCHMVAPVDIPDSDLFLTIISNGGGEITGTVKNNKSSPVVFGIYFGNSGGLGNPSEQATFIGTLNIDGLETLTIEGLDDFNQSAEDAISNMMSFFIANPGISTLYVYLTGEPDPVDLTIQVLQFVLDPSFHMEHVIETNEEYVQYVNQIEDVSDVIISGFIRNNGTGTITLVLSVSNGGGAWDCICVIGAGATMQFADQFNLLTETELDVLEGIMRYYVDPGETIQTNLYIISEQNINITLNSVIFSGTITVTL